MKRQKKEFLSQFESVKSKMKQEDIDKINEALEKMNYAESELQKSIDRLSHNVEVIDARTYSTERKMQDENEDREKRQGQVDACGRGADAWRMCANGAERHKVRNARTRHAGHTR